MHASSNHRRTAKAVEVNLFCGYNRFFPVTAKGIHQDGMFLITRSLSIPVNTRVNLEIVIGDYRKRLSALVSENCTEGIDVLFTKPQPELINIFRHHSRLQQVA